MSKAKKISVRDKVIITVCSVLIAVSVLTVSGLFLLNSRLFANKENTVGGTGGLNSDIVTPPEIEEKTVNFLVCGIDYLEGSGRGKLTDVIMLVSFDIEGKNIDVLQIPRDSFIGDDYPTGKINAIYGQKKNGGIEGLANRINKTFNISIDHYVTINMNGFIRVIDKIGGVEVDVPKRIVLEGTTLEKGKQTLSGYKSQIFVRERHSYANGDLGRIEMQQIFLKALMDKMFSLGNAEVISLVPTFAKEVTTDLTIAQMIGYYSKLDGIDKANGINFHTLPVIGGRYNGLSVVSIKKYPTADLLNEHFRPYSDPVSAEDLGIIEVNKNYEYTSSTAVTSSKEQ